MNKFKKYMLIFIINIIILILGFSNEIYAEYENINAWPLLTQNQNGWYCLQHHLDMFNGAQPRDKYSFSYRSDSSSQFERAMAYIIRDAQNSGDNGWHNGGNHQKAIWGLLYHFRNSLPAPLNRCSISNANAFSNDILTRALAYAGETYSTGNAKITTSKLEMEGDTGKFKINELNGVINSITVKYEGEKEGHTITGWGNDYLFRFYNENGQASVHIGNMTKNTTYQIKNYSGKNIESMSINVTKASSGFMISGDFYISNGVQSIMHATYEPGKESKASANVSVKYLNGEIRVKKVDYETGKLLDGAQFAVFVKDIKDGKTKEGWLGYNTTTKEVTYGNSWKNARKFKTGTEYCKAGKKEGEFTLKNLKFATYYVFEIEPADGYLKKQQYGWDTQSGNGVLTSNEFRMKDSEGKDIPRVLLGDYKTFKDEYIKEQKDGWSELKVMTKNLWEVYNDKRKAIRFWYF